MAHSDKRIGAMSQRADDRRQKTEDRSQKSEVRRQKSEVGGRRAEGKVKSPRRIKTATPGSIIYGNVS